jgi:hypothetical protein
MEYSKYQLVSMFRQGIAIAQIAHMMDITIERVEQILESEGICVKCVG